jgi:hypothetical protein
MIHKWNQWRKQSHRWRLESSVKAASVLTRNRQQNHSRCRLWNHNWNLSDSWSMELTARPTHQIDRKNTFMANAWNCQTHSANADPEIITKNWVTVEQEIIYENWVTNDWWNRQRILTHDWRMKSIKKTESSLMHGIASANCVTTDRKSSAKT